MVANIESALWCPGRIDLVIEVPLPDENTPIQIFNIYTKELLRMSISQPLHIDETRCRCLIELCTHGQYYDTITMTNNLDIVDDGWAKAGKRSKCISNLFTLTFASSFWHPGSLRIECDKSPQCSHIAKGDQRYCQQCSRENTIAKVYLRAHCNPCRYIREVADTHCKEVKLLQANDYYYRVIRANPELIKKKQEQTRKYYHNRVQLQQREWKTRYETMPHLKYITLSTSKFALKVYNNVFESLAS
jgi:hypothetical protein